jgi:hypothetical protein
LKLWDAATGTLIRTFEGHTSPVVSVAFSPDGTRLLSGSEDSTLGIWNPTTPQPLASLIAARDGEWLTVTQTGFFAASPKASELLSVVRGLTTTSIEQIYQSLYAPDLIREKLSDDLDGEVMRAAAALDLEKVLDSGQAPGVALVTPVNAATSTELLTIEANIKDQGGGIGRIEWRVNGITVGVITAASGSTKARTIKQTLALEPGDNIIEVVAYNGRNLLASLPATTTVTWTAPAKQPRPKLFVIAVGINAYDDRLSRDCRMPWPMPKHSAPP